MANDINEFIKHLRSRMRKDWDTVIAITGEEGVGESTLSILLGMKMDDKFDLDKRMKQVLGA